MNKINERPSIWRPVDISPRYSPKSGSGPVVVGKLTTTSCAYVCLFGRFSTVPAGT